MHYAVLKRATVRVADTRDISGRLTAGSINDGARAQTKGRLWRACGLTIFCSVASIGVLASLTPVSAFADPGGIPAEIAELKAEVAALQSQVHALQSQLAAVQSNNALKLGPFVTVDPNPENGVRGPNITFKGANIHIVSGLNATDDNGSPSGLGNLIIGYDELLPNQVVVRGGSHNLVIGRFNSFAPGAFGGLVAGEQNIIASGGASVSAGGSNIASGRLSSVSGGKFNNALSDFSSVSGGQDNFAVNNFASVSGGTENSASGVSSSVSGGEFNNAISDSSSVSGGENNTASGLHSSVSGGRFNNANGDFSSVIGGQNNTANINLSIRPQPPFSP